MTYHCQKCGYGQEIEPTKENLAKYFPELKESCKDFECPCYKLGELIPCKGKMILEDK